MIAASGIASISPTPNNGVLRDTIVTALESFLRQLYERNAFRGATEREAFFVQCDTTLNPQFPTNLVGTYTLRGADPADAAS